MKSHFILLFSSLILLSCQDAPAINTEVETKAEAQDSSDYAKDITVFLIDHCDMPYISVLERDIKKGKDSCILRIKSDERQINRVEVLNIPVDRSSIHRCEEDYVSVDFACGGPCYSEIFVFTDVTRPNEQYSYVQFIENHPNLITHIEKEEFESKTSS